MKILFITAHIYLPQMRGGLQNSTHQLCHELQKKGHKVAVLSKLTSEGWFGLLSRIKMQLNNKLLGHKIAADKALGYRVWRTWEPWEMVAFTAAKEKPDVIVIMAMQSVKMALAARSAGIPILMQLQDVEFGQHGGSFKELGNIICVANSQFTARQHHNAFGITPTVIHPFIVKENYRTETTRENITFINPHPKKGLKIALEVARNCPDIPFVFVEGWPLTEAERKELQQHLASLPNITLMPPQSDMRKVYGKCKILLAPSLWEEAYGRVATEAQLSGIPVIASNRGGLPEAVGPGGILLNPEASPESWANAVRSLWQDQKKYAELSVLAYDYAHRPETQLDYQLGLWEQSLAAVQQQKAA